MAGVLVCGIAVMDHVFGVDVLPSRAEKYRAHSMDVIGGGCAANAAVAIARLGGTAQLLTRLGGDDTGRAIRAELVAEGVDMAPTVVTPGGGSPMSSVFVDAAGERMIINFRGTKLADDAPIPALPDALLADTRWPKPARALFQAARAKGIPAVLDGEAPVPHDLAQAATHVVFSTQGLREFTGADTPEAGVRIAQSALPGWVAVTDGARGLAHMDHGEVVWLAAPKVDVVDTLGAGDVWHGAFALGLAEGMTEIEAARFAHAAAALKCTAFGGRKAAPTRTIVNQFMETSL
jgi:sulfofructose kinase